MDKEIIEEFNERFATVEAALKYIADSQAKSEFLNKQASVRHDKEIAEIRKLQEQTERNLARTEQNLTQTQRHLDHITKVLRFNIEEYEFQEEKITEAGEVLSRQRNR